MKLYLRFDLEQLLTVEQGSQTQNYRRALFQRKILRGPQLIRKKFLRPQFTRKVPLNKLNMIKVYNLTFEGHKNSGNIKKRPPLYGIFLLSLLLFLHRGTLQCKQNKLHLSISITEMYRINRESYR
jgi:hypothetical protein